jgi:sugar phosphate permease
MTNYGWRSPFVVCSIIGIVWSIFWLRFYRNSPSEHRMVNDGELSTINAALGTFAKGRRQVPWGQILRNRQLWLLACMYFCYGYDIGVFLSRFPKYLSSARGIDLNSLGIYASMPLFAGLFGDILGGGISDHLLKKTGNVKFSRRIVSVIGFAMAAVAVVFAAAAESVDVSIAWFCLAVFSFELTVGVSWAITLDIGGEFAGSVSAVMNTLGNIGASIAIVVTGYLAKYYGWSYAFGVIAALAVIAALLTLTIDASRRLYRDTEAAA